MRAYHTRSGEKGKEGLYREAPGSVRRQRKRAENMDKSLCCSSVGRNG